MAKPPLTVIGHAGTGREPPIVLGERGRALWDSLRREFVIADAAGIELLRKPARRLTGPRRYAPRSIEMVRSCRREPGRVRIQAYATSCRTGRLSFGRLK